jgi:hypothetical protein
VDGDYTAFVPHLGAGWGEYLEWKAQGNTSAPDPAYTLPIVKARRIAEMNAVCSQKILAKWPLYIQLGMGDGDVYSSLKEQYITDKSTLIAYSNDTHTVNINALNSIDEVLAYNIDTGWPAI